MTPCTLFKCCTNLKTEALGFPHKLHVILCMPEAFKSKFWMLEKWKFNCWIMLNGKNTLFGSDLCLCTYGDEGLKTINRPVVFEMTLLRLTDPCADIESWTVRRCTSKCCFVLFALRCCFGFIRGNLLGSTSWPRGNCHSSLSTDFALRIHWQTALMLMLSKSRVGLELEWMDAVKVHKSECYENFQASSQGRHLLWILHLLSQQDSRQSFCLSHGLGWHSWLCGSAWIQASGCVGLWVKFIDQHLFLIWVSHKVICWCNRYLS